MVKRLSPNNVKNHSPSFPILEDPFVIKALRSQYCKSCMESKYFKLATLFGSDEKVKNLLQVKESKKLKERILNIILYQRDYTKSHREVNFWGRVEFPNASITRYIYYMDDLLIGASRANPERALSERILSSAFANNDHLNPYERLLAILDIKHHTPLKRNLLKYYYGDNYWDRVISLLVDQGIVYARNCLEPSLLIYTGLVPLIGQSQALEIVDPIVKRNIRKHRVNQYELNDYTTCMNIKYHTFVPDLLRILSDVPDSSPQKSRFLREVAFSSH